LKGHVYGCDQDGAIDPGLNNYMVPVPASPARDALTIIDGGMSASPTFSYRLAGITEKFDAPLPDSATTGTGNAVLSGRQNQSITVTN